MTLPEALKKYDRVYLKKYLKERRGYYIQKRPDGSLKNMDPNEEYSDVIGLDEAIEDGWQEYTEEVGKIFRSFLADWEKELYDEEENDNDTA